MLSLTLLSLAFGLIFIWQVTRWAWCWSAALAALAAAGLVYWTGEPWASLAGAAGVAACAHLFLASCHSAASLHRAVSAGALPTPTVALQEPPAYATVLDAWPEDNLFTVLYDGQEWLAQSVSGSYPAPGDRVRRAVVEPARLLGIVRCAA